MKKSEIADILIRHDDEIKSALAAYVALKDECVAELAAKTSEFSEAERSKSVDALASQVARLRQKLIADSATKLAAVISEEREFSKKELSSIRDAVIAQLVERTDASKSELLLEMGSRLGVMEATQKTFADSITLLRTEMPERIKEFARSSAPAPLSFADIYQGIISEELPFKRGQIWSYKGGTFLAKQYGKGQLPRMRGEDAYWAIIAMPGSNSSRGPIGNQYGISTVTGGLLTLTDAATTNWDMSQPFAKWTLGASRTLAVTNMIAGGTYILFVIQGGSGSFGVTWPSSVVWPGNVAPTLTTTAAFRDVFSFTSDGTNLFASYSQNYNV